MKHIVIILLLVYTGAVYAMGYTEVMEFEQTKTMLTKGSLPNRWISSLKKSIHHMSLENIKELIHITETHLSECSQNDMADTSKYQAIFTILKMDASFKQLKCKNMKL